MKVIHLVWSLTYGGIETMLVNIANSQSAQGAEVCVVIINDLYDKALLQSFQPDVKIVLLHRKRHSKSLLFIWKISRLLHKMHPDVIHLHSSRIFAVLPSSYKKKACVTLHAMPSGMLIGRDIFSRIFPIYNILQKGNVTLINQIPHVFSISEAVRSSLFKEYGVSSDVIANGILVSNFQKRSHKIASFPLHLVQVGRLYHQIKGQDLLIEAVARLDGRINVDFIGDGADRAYLEELVEKQGLSKQIRFLGKQSQNYIAEHLHEYDLFVQPSRFEGFGLTVAEAMAAKVPVLVSAGQGPSEVTCGNLYGWTFENGNVEDLVRKLEYICGHYQEALEKADAARQYVEQSYDVAITAKKYLEAYQKIIAK